MYILESAGPKGYCGGNAYCLRRVNRAEASWHVDYKNALPNLLRYENYTKIFQGDFLDTKILPRLMKLDYGEPTRIITVGNELIIVQKESILNPFMTKHHMARVLRDNKGSSNFPIRRNQLHLHYLSVDKLSRENALLQYKKMISDGLSYQLLKSTRRKKGYNYRTGIGVAGTMLTASIPNNIKDRPHWHYNGYFWLSNVIGCFQNPGYSNDKFSDRVRGDSVGHLFYPGDGTESIDDLPKIEVHYV